MSGMLEALIPALLAFASAETGLGIPLKERPVIEYMTRCEMYVDIYSKPCPEDFDNIVAPGAFYSTKRDIIFLQSGFDPYDPKDQVILVHELTHFLQDMNGQIGMFTCVGKLEEQAYAVGEAYGESISIPDANQTLLGITPLILAGITECRGFGGMFGG